MPVGVRLCVVVPFAVMLADSPAARATGEFVGDGVPDGDCVPEPVTVSEPDDELVGEGLPEPVIDKLGLGVLLAEGVGDGVVDRDENREMVAVGDGDTVDVGDNVGVCESEVVAVGVVDGKEVDDKEPVPVIV